ncbi:hypothetical protein MIMGU_mgv1a019743mg [Erythranthe guttata]|uniref:Uncharacterized protein n=1 Tax=Erythranthe guttata TaxID=4155 RepID=A0A022RUA2_ERYGU|nr:hypothetical protein MIMGU_mgv1a019743mg [Erythranthe guttata]
MLGLKKAYADVLFNISKEAAARVMSSEKKAAQYQNELKTSKDEALRMLMRLKQMMDSKTSEAEAASLSQQSKIDELEAQLQEAEDIVKDLREELEEAHSQLERAKRGNSHHHANEPKNLSLREPGARIYEAAIASYISNPDLLPSIISRPKDPGLYRNGCTQRIRACERNSVETDKGMDKDNNSNKNNKRESEEDEEKVPSTKTKTLSELEEKLMADSNCRSFLQKKKRANRLRKVVKISSVNVDVSVSDKDGGGGAGQSRTARTMSEDSLGDERKAVKAFGGGGSTVLQKDEGLKRKTVDVEKVDVSGANSSYTTVGERVIKYTFQRKRKREALSGGEVKTSVEAEKETEVKKTGDQKMGDQETSDQKTEQSKSSLLSMESSRESRRLAQVARQVSV